MAGRTTFGASIVVERGLGCGDGCSLLFDGGSLEGLEFAECGFEFARQLLLRVFSGRLCIEEYKLDI